MRAIEIARRMTQLEQAAEALNAYIIAVQGDLTPEERMEAACFILQNGGDYKISYTCFLELYQEGHFQQDIMTLMAGAFYLPNVKELRGRYERNCRLLGKYPYLSRKDFPAFEDLPIQFYPYDEEGFVPYYPQEGRFGDYINFTFPKITRNFFKNLDNPILAADVYSQYELEYLNDNVRKSEYVGRENHVYLHYTDWAVFCAYLQCLNMRPLLKDEKFVFLIDGEVSQYPIDFKERYGIDYSQFPIKPLGIREINRVIWHTQLSTHNGGDFFNEIFDGHPNLLAHASIMFDEVEQMIADWRKGLCSSKSSKEKEREFIRINSNRSAPVLRELSRMKDPTDKDIFVAAYLSDPRVTRTVDPAARVAPAVFFQPHFQNVVYSLRTDKQNNTVLASEQYDRIISTPILRGFRYVKTFTPLRRFTTSHGGTVHYMHNRAEERAGGEASETGIRVVPDVVTQRVLNRSFMVDWQDRLFQDCVLVRLEDGKLNPKATFTALCAFLDLPYTQSMTYGSEFGERIKYKNPAGVFNLKPVYKTYHEFANDSERIYIEYFLRDAYQFYGYDFLFYDGRPMTIEQVDRLTDDFTTIDRYIRETWNKVYQSVNFSANGQRVDEQIECQVRERLLENQMRTFHENRRRNSRILMEGLQIANRSGQPMRMMPLLKLEPALLENPVYR